MLFVVVLLFHLKTLKKKGCKNWSHTSKRPWNTTTNHQPHPQSAFSFTIILFPFHYCFWKSCFLFSGNLWELLWCGWALFSRVTWSQMRFLMTQLISQPQCCDSLLCLSFHKCPNTTWKVVGAIGRRSCDSHGSPEWQKAKVPPPQGQSQTQRAAQRVRKWAVLTHVIVAYVALS